MHKFYVIWIEGIGARRGEKVKSFNKDGTIEYTTLLTEAMRVRANQIAPMRAHLRSLGVAEWTLVTQAFHGTNYAPTGTICKSIQSEVVHVEPLKPLSSQLTLL